MFENKKVKFGRVITFILLALTALFWVFPLVWILSTSFKTEGEVILGGFNLIPKQFTLATYQDALFNKTIADQMPIFKWFWNSVFIGTVHTVLMLFISSLAAFAYARLEFKGRDKLFYILLSTMMVPPVINLVPLYKIMTILKWIDKPWAMIFPGLGGVFAVFLIRQFMLGIPKEFDESAKIDGASLFTIYRRIILPLTKPALIVVSLFTFLNNWNDFLWPTIVTNDIAKRTLPAGLRVLQGYLTTQYAKISVASVISALPVVVIFLFAQKYFTKGISLSAGVKG